MKLKSHIFLFLGLTFASLLAAEEATADSKVKIDGSPWKVIEVTPEASTGLGNIFVVRDIAGCNLQYNASSTSGLKVMRFSNMGGGYAEEITNLIFEGTTVIIENPAGDMGYIFEDSGRQYAIWIVDYKNHEFTINDFAGQDEQDCDYSLLTFSGNAAPITYFTINGQSKTLSRDIFIDYTTQEFDRESKGFFNTNVRKTFESLPASIMLSPPAYCASYFTVTGDRFLREWNAAITRETNVIQPVAVDCSTDAEQHFNFNEEEGSNIIKGDESALGGSAPADISFTSYTSEAVIYYEWQIARDQDFQYLEYSFKQKDLDYTFNEEGTFFVRFIGSNSEGTCDTYGDTYTVAIGASELKCPNAFSPNDDGVNDVWKVSYRSLIDFHCEIFNRNGQPIYSFNSPDGGWDGTWNGKKVKSGVYYYVITATGADGKKYKKSGDINIIHSKIQQNSYQDSFED